MKSIQLLLPMSGRGTRFLEAGYTAPKPLIDINGRVMIDRVLEAFPESWPSHFVVSAEHQKSGLKEHLLRLRPTAQLYVIPAHSLGPGHAIAAALEGLADDAPVLVSYCDYGMSWDSVRFADFVAKTDCDACVVCYRGFHPHYLSPQKYAYCRMDGEHVVEVREKGSFTDQRENEYASCGAYFQNSSSAEASP